MKTNQKTKTNEHRQLKVKPKKKDLAQTLPSDGGENKQCALERQENQAQLENQIEELNQARVKSDAALRQLTDLMSHSQDLICTHDMEGNLLFVNEAGTRLSGYSNKVLLKMNLREVLATDVRHKFGAYLAQVNLQKQARGVLKIQTAAGEIRYLEYNNTLQAEGLPAPLVHAIARDVTERKLAEDAQRLAETRYHSLFNQAHDAVFILDLQGRHQAANKRAAEMLGYDYAEVQQLSMADTSNELPQSMEKIERLLRGEQLPVYERIFRRKDGSLIPVEINVELVRDANGRPLHIQSIARDISERRRAEEALRVTHQVLETIFNNTHIMIAYLDPQFNFLQVNQAYAAADNREPSFFAGRNHFDLYPNEENQAVFQQVVDTGRPHFSYAKPFEYAEHPERGVTHWDWSLTPIKSPDGQVEGLILSLLNVSERVIAEETLRRAEARNRAVLKAIPDLVFRLNRDGVFLDYHARMEDELYIPSGEIVGKNIRENMPPDFAELVLENIHATLESGEVQMFEYSLPFENGLRSYEARMSVSGADEVVAIVRDISERRRAEEKLRRSEENLRRITDNMLDLVSQVNPLGYFSYVSPSHAAVLGYSPDELMGRELMSFIHPDDLPKATAVRQEMAQGKIPGLVKFRFRHAAGHYLWLEASISSISDERGQRGGAIFGGRDITQREQAERLLMESEERYRGLYENATIGMYRTTFDGHILMANPALVHMLGYESFEELTRRGLEKTGYEPNHPRSEFLRKIKQDGIVHGLESAWKRRDGSVIFVRESARAVQDESGRETYYEGTVEDITERKQAEEKYHAIFENSLDGIFQSTLDGRFLTVNPALARMWGYDSPSDLMASVTDTASQVYVNPGIRERHVRLLKEQGGSLSGFEYQAKRKDGSVVWVSESVRSVLDAEGKFLYFEGMVEDISARKQAEEQLRLSQSTYQGIINSVTEAVYIQDESGAFLDVNLASEKLYGYPKEAFIGNTPAFLSAPGKNDLPAVVECVRKAFEGEPQQFEFWGLRKDGSIFPKDVSLTAGSYFGKKVIIAVARDITERKQAEDALREAETKYRMLVERLPVVVYTSELGADGRWPYVGPQIEVLLGFTPQEWMADPGLWFRQVHPDDRDRQEQLEEQAYLRGEAFVDEYRIFTRDGRQLWVRDSAQVLPPQGNGRPIVQGILMDVTERKQAEEALRWAEERYHNLFEEAPLMYISTRNVEGLPIITECNQTFLRATGYSRQEVMGRPLADFYTPESRVRLTEGGGYKRAMEYSLQAEERELVTRDGRIIHTVLTAVGEYDEHGNVIGTRAMYVDITERKQAEQALSANEIRYRSLFEDSPIALWEEDFSAVKQRLDLLRGEGVTDFNEYFHQHPQLVLEFASLVKVLGVNKAAIRLFNARQKNRLAWECCGIHQGRADQTIPK